VPAAARALSPPALREPLQPNAATKAAIANVYTAWEARRGGIVSSG
jgi:hypothetical protein